MRLATVADALAFVQESGVVLASAKGPVPRLTEAIVGEPIKGSWWGHPQSRLIYSILAGINDSEQVVVCRLIDGKLTLVHRRLWPSLVRLAACFTPQQLAQVREEHTPSGHHISRAIPFPRWVPPDILEHALGLTEESALRSLGSWVPLSRQDSRRD